MAVSELNPAIEKHTKQIQLLTHHLSELTNNVRNLAEAQKDLRNLFRSQIEHNMEIQSLKFNFRELNETLQKIHERINMLEAHQMTTHAVSTARSNLVDAIIRYAPII